LTHIGTNERASDLGLACHAQGRGFANPPDPAPLGLPVKVYLFPPCLGARSADHLLLPGIQEGNA
jgi:hypothetical protein